MENSGTASVQSSVTFNGSNALELTSGTAVQYDRGSDDGVSDGDTFKFAIQQIGKQVSLSNSSATVAGDDAIIIQNNGTSFELVSRNSSGTIIETATFGEDLGQWNEFEVEIFPSESKVTARATRETGDANGNATVSTSGASNLRYVLLRNDTANSGSVYFDDVSYQKSSETVEKATPLTIQDTGQNLSNYRFSDKYGVSEQESNPEGIEVTDFGNKLYVTGQETSKVFNYSLPDTNDLSNPTLNNTFDYSQNTGSATDVVLVDFGSKMFLVDNFNAKVDEYNLTTAYDLTTASYVQSLDVSSQESNPRACTFDTASRLLVVGESGLINEYSLSNYDLSTASFEDSLDISSKESFPSGIVVDDNDILVTGFDSNKIYKYSTTDLTVASFKESTYLGFKGECFGLTKQFSTLYVVDTRVRKYGLAASESSTGSGEIVIPFDNISSEEDIAFYDEKGELLDYDIEFLDVSNGKAKVWVYRDWPRDGSIPAQIAYGNNSADTDRQDVEATWDHDGQNAEAVYKMNESSGQTLDATSNNLDSVSTTNTNFGIDTFLGKARGFDGNSGIKFEPSNKFNFSDFTLACLVDSDSYSKGSKQTIISANEGTEGFSLFNDAFENNLTFEYSGGDTTKTLRTGNVTAQRDYHVVAEASQFDSSARLFLNSNKDGSATGEFDLADGDNNFRIGFSSSGENFEGLISAVRLYSDKKSEEWVKADYDAGPAGGHKFLTQQAPEFTSDPVTLEGNVTVEGSSQENVEVVVYNKTQDKLEGLTTTDQNSDFAITVSEENDEYYVAYFYDDGTTFYASGETTNP